MIPGQGDLDQALAEAHAYLSRDPADTSREAALRVLPRSATQRRQVLAAVVYRGSYGITDDELCVSLSIEGSSERPRRLELVEGGWIEDSGKRRKTRKGGSAIVWVLTEEGKARLRAGEQAT